MGSGAESDSEGQASKRTKIRKWLLRIALSCSLLVLALLYLGNGFGARYLIKQYANEQLETLGLSGDFKISGTASWLYHGDFDYTGDAEISSIQFEELKVVYSIGELRDAKIRAFSLTLKAHMDLSNGTRTLRIHKARKR